MIILNTTAYVYELSRAANSVGASRDAPLVAKPGEQRKVEAQASV